MLQIRFLYNISRLSVKTETAGKKFQMPPRIADQKPEADGPD